MERSNRQGPASGYTMIEMVIAAIVIVIITAIAMRTLFRDREKQRLLTAAYGIVDVLNEAQKQATTQRQTIGVCFKSTGNNLYVQDYVPALGSNGLPTDSDCTGSDALGTKYSFASTVNLCATCDANIGLNKGVFFSSLGFPILANGNSSSYQICITNSNLPTGYTAREVEVTTGGVVQLIKPGSPGDISSVQANVAPCQ